MGTKLYKEPREKKHEDFGKKLKEARKLKYKYQQEFADAIGAKVETVRNWEQGWILPEMGTLFKICDILDCDLDYLIGRLEYKKHDTKMISDYTGLSEDAVTALHLYKNADDRRSLWPSYLSDIINNKDFFTLMGKISEFMGDTKLEVRLKDYVSKMQMIDQQSADMFYINHIFTNILEDMAAHERSHERSR